MILFIDNFDSFTYNLVQAFSFLNQTVHTVRNNQISIEQCKRLNPSCIVIGPGPKTPSDAGICKTLISYFLDQIPILGICLGHQAIGEVLGAHIIKIPPKHGKTSPILHTEHLLFSQVKQRASMMRYHSLAIDPKTLPDSLQIICTSEDDNQIMGIAHKDHPVYGIQFHPESFFSEDGTLILKNFLDINNIL